MKVVVIADNLGNNAPGVVFRNILSGISGKIEIDIVTSTMDYQIPLIIEALLNMSLRKGFLLGGLGHGCLTSLAFIIHRGIGQEAYRIY